MAGAVLSKQILASILVTKQLVIELGVELERVRPGAMSAVAERAAAATDRILSRDPDLRDLADSEISEVLMRVLQEAAPPR